MKYHKLENVEKPLDSLNKFSYDLTLEFKSLTKDTPAIYIPPSSDR